MTAHGATLVVIAKAPVPGRAKTRLSPPLTSDQAAHVARAALEDTLEAVTNTDVPRRVLVLDGAPGPWVPGGVEVLPQRGGGLDQRLSAAFDDVGGPALLIGMDTPQVTPELLAACCERLTAPGVGAVLGPAEDGGFWAVGLRRPDPRALLGIPMSTARTGRRQAERLHQLGLRVATLPVLRDVDDVEDALAVAVAADGRRFAAAVGAVLGGHAHDAASTASAPAAR
jgi:rSAM/selenodomain-associated transferase 1